MRSIIISFAVLIILLLLAISYGFQQEQQPSTYAIDNISDNRMTSVSLIENDDKEDKALDVTRIILEPTLTHSNSIILNRISYVTSYNKDTRQPNWVAWWLTSEHTDGPYSRKGVPYYNEKGIAIGIPSFSANVVQGDYFMDMEVPVPRQEHDDWKEHPADMDHGHICPAADCKWDKGAMNQSFLLTNMCPQNHELNGGDWDKLENKCRTWAKRYGQIYIVAGPIFDSERSRCFGPNNIPIPAAFFKIVLCLSESPKAIGFIFPNVGTHHNLEEYVVTVDKVEDVLGMDFFIELPDDVEEEIEAYSNINSW